MIFPDNLGIIRKKNSSASGLCAKNLLTLRQEITYPTIAYENNR